MSISENSSLKMKIGSSNGIMWVDRFLLVFHRVNKCDGSHFCLDKFGTVFVCFVHSEIDRRISL